jgi:hypothetical protein
MSTPMPARPDDIAEQNRRIAAENERVRAEPQRKSWFSRHPVWTVILILVVLSSIGNAIKHASQPAFTASDGTTLSSADVADIEAGWNQGSSDQQRLFCEAVQNPAGRAYVESSAASKAAEYDITPDQVGAMLEYLDQELC